MRLIKEGIDAKAAAAKDAAAQKEADGGKPGKVAKSTISKSLVLDMVEHAIREEVILRLKLKARQDWRREEINARQLHEILRGCVPLAWACAPHREAINAWTVSSLLKEQKEIERRRAFLTFLMNEEKKLERGDASSDVSPLSIRLTSFPRLPSRAFLSESADPRRTNDRASRFLTLALIWPLACSCRSPKRRAGTCRPGSSAQTAPCAGCRCGRRTRRRARSGRPCARTSWRS